MRPKYFTAQSTAAINGELRTIFVAGKWEKKKVTRTAVVTKNRVTTIAQIPVYEYSLTLGKAICHHDDKFDASVGMKLALKRIKNGGLGRIKTEDYTMLTEDACQVLVDNKAKYIAANIERFIPAE